MLDEPAPRGSDEWQHLRIGQCDLVPLLLLLRNEPCTDRYIYSLFGHPHLSDDLRTVLEEEKSIILAQLNNDPKNANKPQQILEKMVVGKLGKFYEKNCLLEQSYIKDDKISVGAYVNASAKELGGSIKVVGYSLYEKGEGLEKREDDFAAEIAKMVNKA